MKNNTDAGAPKKSMSARFCKKNLIKAAVSAASFSFTLLFFSGSDIVLNNQRDFAVNAADILRPLFLCSLALTAAVFGVLCLCLAVHEKLFRAVCDLLLGLTAAGYVQSLFMNGEMNELTGTSVSYLDDTAMVGINSVIFLEMTLLPPIADIYISGRKKENDGGNIITRNPAVYVLLVIMFMQTAGFAGSYAANDPANYKKDYSGYVFSYEPMLSLSEESNICVFLLDRLDSFWMDDMLELYPGLYDELDGFTFYRDNLSHYQYTFPSVPSMLTGVLYPYTDPDMSFEYMNSAWDRDIPLDRLRENGYSIYLAPDRSNTYNNMNYIVKHTDNAVIPADSSYTIEYGVMIPAMVRMSVSRLVPYIFKASVWNGIGADISEKFITYTYPSAESYIPFGINTDSDKKFYRYITSHEMNSDSEKKVFSFVHMDGAHGADDEIASLCAEKPLTGIQLKNDVDWNIRMAKTVRGEFAIVLEFMNSAKKLGIYDKCTFIILADHGRQPMEGAASLESPLVTTLIVKPAGETSHPLYINDSAQLTNEMFSASVLEYAGIDHESAGLSYNDVIYGNTEVVRYNRGAASDTEYVIRGNSRDFSNWTKQQRVSDQ